MSGGPERRSGGKITLPLLALQRLYFCNVFDENPEILYSCGIGHKYHIIGSMRLPFGSIFVVLCTFAKAHAAQSLSLAWDRSADPSVSGYRLHCGTHSGVYTQTIEIGNATATLISNLVEGATYFFAVTAYRTASLESSLSNEVLYRVPVSRTTTTRRRTPSRSPTISVSATPTGIREGETAVYRI